MYNFCEVKMRHFLVFLKINLKKTIFSDSIIIRTCHSSNPKDEASEWDHSSL